jgi:hypothetical protein
LLIIRNAEIAAVLSVCRPNGGGGRIFASLATVPEQSRITSGQAGCRKSTDRLNATRGIRSKLFSRKKSDDRPTRKSVTRADLEQSLAEAVRTSHPEFETFAGVIVEGIVPAGPGDTNWAVRGVKYGRADRHRSGIVLSYCVEEAQLEFEISD